jgi:hypothetical protein
VILSIKKFIPIGWNDFIHRLEQDIDGPLMGLVSKNYTKS